MLKSIMKILTKKIAKPEKQKIGWNQISGRVLIVEEILLLSTNQTI